MDNEQSFGSHSFSKEERKTITVNLGRQLDKSTLESRKGPGGTTLWYIPGFKVFEQANSLFGFDGWSTSVEDVKVDYADKDSNKWSIGVTAIMKVVLKNGAYRQDIGFGTGDGRVRAVALENAKKEAVTDGIKRCLRQFGPALGGSVYDKPHLKKYHQEPTPSPYTNDQQSVKESEASKVTAAASALRPAVQPTPSKPAQPPTASQPQPQPQGVKCAYQNNQPTYAQQKPAAKPSANNPSSLPNSNPTPSNPNQSRLTKPTMPQAASARASNTTNQNQYSNQFHSYPQQNNQQVYGNATSSSSHDIADHRDDAQLKAQTRDMDAQNQAFLDAFNDSKAPPGLSQDQLNYESSSDNHYSNSVQDGTSSYSNQGQYFGHADSAPLARPSSSPSTPIHNNNATNTRNQSAQYGQAQQSPNNGVSRSNQNMIQQTYGSYGNQPQGPQSGYYDSRKRTRS